MVVAYLVFFKETVKIIFQSGCTILHFYQQCMIDTVSLYSPQNLLLSQFFMLSILIGIYWYYHVVLVWIPQLSTAVEHLFKCLIWHLFIFNEMSMPFALVLTGLFGYFLQLNSESSLYILDTSLLSNVWLLLCQKRVFFPFWKMSFYILFFLNIFLNYLFIWLHQVLVAAWELLVAACGIQFPDQGLNPGPLH